MSLTIQPDQFVAQELESRGVDSSVGVYGSHHVQIGKGTPVRIDQIKSASLPFAGFKTATQVRRGLAGVEQTSRDVLKTLAAPGRLDAGKLLGLLKAGQTHVDRLARLNALDQKKLADSDGLWMFTKAVENLSNEDLASIFQKFTSAEMDLLQTALMHEGQSSSKAGDARMAAARLFNLQALVLKEIGNRAALSNLSDLRAANPADESLKDEKLALPQKLSDEYGTSGAEDVPAPVHGKDITATNLAILAEVSSQSANQRENIAVAEKEKLASRGLSDVQLKEMGDVLRSAELTINIPLEILAGNTSVFADPNKPLANIWHLHDQHIDPKGQGYLDKRDSVEKILFPEFAKHGINADERPVYGALNIQHGFNGGSPVYGNAVIVLKPEVSRRATYTLIDSFLSTPLKVDDSRRADFYRLLDGTPRIPDALKDALRNPESSARKGLDQLFEKLKRYSPPRACNCMARDFPASIKEILKTHDNADHDGETAFLGLMYSCFANPEDARKEMATYDNIETLLPKLGDVNGNSLARAALEKRAGRTPKFALDGPEYIEAQIQGPIMPLRDIAEIRVNTGFIDDPGQREEYIAKMKDFQRQTGIKVVFQDIPYFDSDDPDSKLSEKQYQFNAQHLDMGGLNALKENVLSDPIKAARDYIAEFEPIDMPEGVEPTLTGPALSEAIAKFKEKVAADSAKPSSCSAAEIVRYAVRDLIAEPMRAKARLLRELQQLPFETPEQKKVFTDWITSTPGLSSLEVLRAVHQQATARAGLLREIATAEPPPTDEEVLECFALLQTGAAAADPATVANMTIALLRNAVPPVTPAETQKMLDLLDSPLLRGCSAQLDAIAGAKTLAGVPKADREAIRSLSAAFTATASALAASINAPWNAPRECLAPLSAVQANVRAAVRQVSPALADALDAAHPAHPPFPPPANADALPSNKDGRKQFLMGLMETYREKELNSERGRSVHGRGHIIRAYFYATAFCNILAEQGIKVDRNAVILGIAGHDLGRRGLGSDRWEEVSGNMTGAAIREQYGADAAGEAYEKEIADSIVGVEIHPEGQRKRTIPASPTLEAQLLQSADSLDIGRTGDFDQYYFDFLRDKNGNVHPDAQKIRDQLAKEANLLQRLTNPLCANYHTLLKLGMDAGNADGPLATELEKQRDALDEQITNEMIAQANNADNEAFFDDFEDVIRQHPQMFPLLTKYYLNAE